MPVKNLSQMLQTSKLFHYLRGREADAWDSKEKEWPEIIFGEGVDGVNYKRIKEAVQKVL